MTPARKASSSSRNDKKPVKKPIKRGHNDRFMAIIKVSSLDYLNWEQIPQAQWSTGSTGRLPTLATLGQDSTGKATWHEVSGLEVLPSRADTKGKQFTGRAKGRGQDFQLETLMRDSNSAQPVVVRTLVAHAFRLHAVALEKLFEMAESEDLIDMGDLEALNARSIRIEPVEMATARRVSGLEVIFEDDLTPETLVPLWTTSAGFRCDAFLVGIPGGINFPDSFLDLEEDDREGEMDIAVCMSITANGDIRFRTFVVTDHFEATHVGPMFLAIESVEAPWDKTVPLAAFLAWGQRI